MSNSKATEVKIRTSISYSKKVETAMKTLAEKEKRSLSSYIEIVLEEHLKSKGIDVNAKKKPRRKRPSK